MTQRIDYAKVAPGGFRAIMGVESWVRQSGLDHTLIHLAKLRASYLNGCAYCVDMHSKDARIAGESEQRIYSVPVWRETPFYSARERAALLWTEAVTELGREGVSDALFAEVRSHFTDEEIAHLTTAVIAINMWNRLAIALGAEVGSYQPVAAVSAA
ncbi:MAG: carboxymuconolactone decarboxylase family protein [Gemmatimonadaceae bacterium]